MVVCRVGRSQVLRKVLSKWLKMVNRLISTSSKLPPMSCGHISPGTCKCQVDKLKQSIEVEFSLIPLSYLSALHQIISTIILVRAIVARNGFSVK